MISSDQMKHACHIKGSPHSHFNTQCTPIYWQRGRVFSHANGHEGGEWHPAIDCPKHLAPCVALWQWLWEALKNVSSRFMMSIRVQLARDLEILLARAVAHHKEHVALQQPYVDVHCSAEKAHHHPVEEMSVARD